MNVLDRVIAAVAPEAGLRRANARAMLGHYGDGKRDYAAAGHGRRNKNWLSRFGSTSANVEVATAMTTLRNRARDFARNSWQGVRILDVLCSHIVGTGIKIVPNTGSDRADNRFRQVIADWEPVADVEGVMDFGALQALALRSMVEGGDCIVRFIDIGLGDAAGSAPFRLAGLEGDQIDARKDISMIGQNCRLGVQFGDFGRREGVWLYRQHPGEWGGVNIMESDMHAWSDLCHLYRPLRFGQVRGVTWFAPVLLTGKDMQDLMEAAIVQARTQASFAGFLKRAAGSNSPFAPKADETTGQKVTRIEPGTVADIGDSDIVFAQPSGQSAFGETWVSGLQAMAAGAGLTYDQLTGDLRQANYSSLRAGKIEFRRLVEQVQWHIMAPRLVAPAGRRLVSRATLAGMLPPRRDGYRFDMVMPAVEPIDPLKDLEADVMAVRSGRMSPQQFISAWGEDWRDVLADTKAFFALVDRDKLALDIDPRRPLSNAANPKGNPNNAPNP
jgi:lambda family phage portal protein